MNKSERERESGGSGHSSKQIDARTHFPLYIFFSVCLYPKLRQEVRVFVTSTCDPQPSMLCSPRGGQGGSSQAWAVTSG